MENTKKKDGTVYLGVIIPEELHAQVKEIAERKAKETGMRFTLSDVTRVALTGWVKNETAQAK